MYIDKEVELVSNQPLDLETDRPGPGQPIQLYGTGLSGNVDVYMGDTSGTLDDFCVSIVPGADGAGAAFLPTTTKRYIKATITGSGRVFVVDTAQTNDAAI